MTAHGPAWCDVCEAVDGHGMDDGCLVAEVRHCVTCGGTLCQVCRASDEHAELHGVSCEQGPYRPVYRNATRPAGRYGMAHGQLNACTSRGRLFSRGFEAAWNERIRNRAPLAERLRRQIDGVAS